MFLSQAVSLQEKVEQLESTLKEQETEQQQLATEVLARQADELAKVSLRTQTLSSVGR